MLDPDRDEARELLRRELSTADYNRPESLIQKAVTWLLDRITGMIDLVPGSTGLSTLLLGVVIALAAVAVFFAIRGTRRSRRLSSRDTGPVLAETGLSADDYRARAAAAAGSGHWDAALLDSYRAIAAATDERALLDELPGTTAREIAVALRTPFPDRGDEALWAAEAFDAVCYGDQHATQEQAERVRELDRMLARTRPERVVL